MPPPSSTDSEPDKRAGAASKTAWTFTGLGCKSSAILHLRADNAPWIPMETWQSGRMRCLGKAVSPQGLRGFESLRLRHITPVSAGVYAGVSVVDREVVSLLAAVRSRPPVPFLFRLE
jgi:hypothetical protein